MSTEADVQVDTEVQAPNIDTGVNDVDAGKTAEQEALQQLEGHDVEITNNGENEKATNTDKKADDVDKKEKEDKPEDTVKAVEQDVKEQMKAEDDIKSDLQTKGVDFDALADEYEENGKLSEESYKALEDAGYPKSAINAFIKGFEATAQSYTNAIYNLAGGENEYVRMCEFIKGLGQNEVTAFNDAIEHGNLTQLSAMIEGYKARMTIKYGTSNRSILGSGVGAVSQSGFNSKDAMIKAMNDPRYGNDMAYTEKVQRLTMQSNFMG